MPWLWLIACTPDFSASTERLLTDHVAIDLQEAPAVDAAMADAARAADLVGLVAGVAEPGRVVYLGAWGLADRDRGVPMDPHRTHLRWASIAKPLTGVTAVQAWLRHEADLDAPVEALVPGHAPTHYRPRGCDDVDCAEPLDEVHISLRDLLQHAAGAPHYRSALTDPVPPRERTGDPRLNTGMAWALPHWTDQPAVNRPGTRFHYSTFGYNLAGVAVEATTGRSLEALVDRRVARPLGMTTLAVDRVWEPIPGRAVGYVHVDGAVLEDDDTDVSWKLAGGGFLSTAEDLTRFCAGLLGEALLPVAVRDEVLWMPTGPADDYALGFRVAEDDDGRRIHHYGKQEKAKTGVLWLPDEDVCFTVMSNTRAADPATLLATLESAWRSAR